MKKILSQIQPIKEALSAQQENKQLIQPLIDQLNDIEELIKAKEERDTAFVENVYQMRQAQMDVDQSRTNFAARSKARRYQHSVDKEVNERKLHF